MDVELQTGKTGQFDIVVDGKTVVTRGGNWFTQKFGAGYPKTESVLSEIERL